MTWLTSGSRRADWDPNLAVPDLRDTETLCWNRREQVDPEIRGALRLEHSALCPNLEPYFR